jgi:uncharacterized membrane protein
MTQHRISIIALIVSLAVNLAVLGFTVARWGFTPPHIANAIHISPRWAHHLPKERRKELRPILREQFRRAQAQRPLLHEKHQAVRRALAAEDFQGQALDKALNELRIALEGSQRHSHAAFSQFVRELTQQERKELADELAKKRRKRDHKKPTD